MKFDAIVIGAGPAGSAAAISLRRASLSVGIVEKAEFPRRKVCGEFLSATNIPLLEHFGLKAIWDTAGPEVERIALYSGDLCLETSMPRAQGGFGRALGRDVLDTMLLQAAADAGTYVFQPWRTTAIKRDGQFVVEISDGAETRRISAPIVVAAHGSWDNTGLSTCLPRRHGTGDFLGFKAHFKNAKMPRGLMPLLVFPGGYGGMVWADDGRLSISCCIRKDRLSELRRDGAAAGAAVADHLMRSCRGVRETLAGASLQGQWLSAGPIRPAIRSGYADGIFRVGNIAGESHPIIAEGISMGLQSGWLLGATLNGVRIDDAAALYRAGQAYDQAWRRQFATRIRAASVFAALAARPWTAALMRAVVGAMPTTLSVAARLSGKTRALPLSVNSPATAR